MQAATGARLAFCAAKLLAATQACIQHQGKAAAAAKKAEDTAAAVHLRGYNHRRSYGLQAATGARLAYCAAELLAATQACIQHQGRAAAAAKKAEDAAAAAAKKAEQVAAATAKKAEQAKKAEEADKVSLCIQSVTECKMLA